MEKLSKKGKDYGVLTFSPIRGRHYLVARGNTVIREIFYDENESAPILPISPLIPGFERLFTFPFTWKSLMTEQDAEVRNLRPLITYQRNILGSGENIDDTVKPQKMCIVQRSVDDQYYLLDREVHPIEIDIASSDGSDTKLVFTYTVLIHDMRLLLAKFPAGNFLQYAENMIVAELRTVLPSKTFDQLRGASGTPEDPIGLQDDLDTIKDDLNRNEFVDQYGFEFLKIMHEDWILTPVSAKRLEKIQEAEIAKKEKQITVTKAEGEADAIKLKGDAEIYVATKKATDVGNAEVEVLKKKVKAITPFQKDLNSTAVSVAEKLGQTKGTVVLGNDGLGNKNPLTDLLVANSIQNTQNSKKAS